MVVSASALRADIYRLLDSVLESGEPIDIERSGRWLRISPVEPVSKLDRLVSRPDVVAGDSEDFVHLDWSDQWQA